MLYQRPTFQLPASGRKTTEQNWDRAFLTRDEYFAKYGEEPVQK